MEQTIRHGLARACALLLTAIMAVSLALCAATTARADDKQQELQNRKDELQSQIDALDKQIAANQDDIQAAQQRKEKYEEQRNIIISQISDVNAKIEEVAAQIAQKEDEIHTKEGEIDQKQAEYDSRWVDFKKRMEAMQVLNDGGAIALLSSATNLYELLTFAQTLEDISSKDRQICTELENRRVELVNEKQDLETAKADLESNRAALQEQQTQLDGLRGELTTNIQATSAEIDQEKAEAEMLELTRSETQKKFDEAANELEAYLRQLISQAQQSNSTSPAPITCSLNFINPLPSYTYISCYFGSGGHRGVDFAAPGWTPIYAIADGQVIKVDQHYSYGNYVMVYHGSDSNGNTYASLYAHMIQWPSVSVGQAVTQGTLLGYVGSTGNSTGNHLHLELHVNNALANPLSYVPR